MDAAERAAKSVIEAVIRGGRMEFHSDQSHSIVDFDLEYADGTVAAVEATASVNQQRLVTEARVRKGGHFVGRSQCRKDWFVFPSVGADIRRIRENVDQYLAAIEADGLSQFHNQADADLYASVQRIVEDLNIEGGGVVHWKTPGIGLGGLGWSGTVSAHHVQAAVEHEANKEDNKKKLLASGRAERHLFVHIDPTNSQSWIAVRDLAPPDSPPRLPMQITEVWVAACAGSVNGWIVWRGNSAGWQNVGLVTVS
jgi:hypothetical protein